MYFEFRFENLKDFSFLYKLFRNLLLALRRVSMN